MRHLYYQARDLFGIGLDDNSLSIASDSGLPYPPTHFHHRPDNDGDSVEGNKTHSTPPYQRRNLSNNFLVYK